MLRRLCTTLLICISLIGCTSMGMEPGFMKPFSLEMKNPPPGPPNYQQGFIDGCESGWKGYGTHSNSLFFDFKQDGHKAQDPVYYQIWKDAYSYCAVYAMSTGNQGTGENNRKGAWILGEW